MTAGDGRLELSLRAELNSTGPDQASPPA